jgi:hypothetical protein
LRRRGAYVPSSAWKGLPGRSGLRTCSGRPMALDNGHRIPLAQAYNGEIHQYHFKRDQKRTLGCRSMLILSVQWCRVVWVDTGRHGAADGANKTADMACDRGASARQPRSICALSEDEHVAVFLRGPHTGEMDEPGFASGLAAGLRQKRRGPSEFGGGGCSAAAGHSAQST